MTARITIDAPAKVNLNLTVTGRNDRGYHTLDSVVVFASVADTLTINLAANDDFSISGEFASITPHEDNLVLKAVSFFRAATGWDSPLNIHLKKSLPLAAGLGGGSSDAAATLKALGILSGITLEPKILRKLALKLGSDVPVLLLAHDAAAAWLGGVGDQVMPLSVAENIGLVLVNDGVKLPTDKVFAAFTRQSLKQNCHRDKFRGCESFDIKAAIAYGNDLEAAALGLAPHLSKTLRWVKVLSEMEGGVGYGMSGSGGTCFALFTNPSAATVAAATESKNCPEKRWLWVGRVLRPHSHDRR